MFNWEGRAESSCRALEEVEGGLSLEEGSPVEVQGREEGRNLQGVMAGDLSPVSL